MGRVYGSGVWGITTVGNVCVLHRLLYAPVIVRFRVLWTCKTDVFRQPPDERFKGSA